MKTLAIILIGLAAWLLLGLIIGVAFGKIADAVGNHDNDQGRTER